ncbi:MAG: PepSY domain-containing protein [Gammaproteobacteria bacterium]
MNNSISAWKAVVSCGALAAAFGSGVASANPAGDVLVVAQADQRARNSYLSIEQIVSQLEASGFRVYEIELDDGRYEVEALDASDNKVDLDVDPETGEILHQELDD